MNNLFHFTELTPDINKCCSACFNRIARSIGTNPQTNELLVPLVPENNDGNLSLTYYSHTIVVRKYEYILIQFVLLSKYVIAINQQVYCI